MGSPEEKTDIPENQSVASFAAIREVEQNLGVPHASPRGFLDPHASPGTGVRCSSSSSLLWGL